MKGLLILWLSLLIFLSPIALSCLFQGTAACSLLWCLNLITNGDTLTGTDKLWEIRIKGMVRESSKGKRLTFLILGLAALGKRDSKNL